MKLEGAYYRDGWANSSQIWNVKYSTPTEYPQQKYVVCFCSGITKLRMCEDVFLVPALVCCTPVLGRMTQYCVS